MSRLDPVTFPLESSRLIEASAGTGKTFTISLLYLRLVLGHRGPDQPDARPLTPPEILVSTFTDAAVAELRDRIRSRLQEAAWLFSGSVKAEEVDPPLRALHDAFDEEQRRRGAFLLQRAAEWMDEAAIFTIHGFCQRMLREHAFHSRALFEQELVTDLDPIIAEAVRDFWRSHGYPLAGRSDAIARQFAQLVPPPGKLREQIKDLIKRDGSPVALGEVTARHAADLPSSPADLLERVTDEQADIDRAEETARARWREEAASLRTLWEGVRDGLNRRNHPEAADPGEFEAWLASVDAWAAGETGLEPKARKQLACPKTRKGTEPPSHPALEAIRDWHDRVEAMASRTREIEPAIRAFAALWVRDRIATLLARRRSMGFEDMLIQMREAVDPAANPNAAGMIEAIRRQYPVALIDEFQDTDPLQYAIFSAIYPLGQNEAGDTAIVLIGDPKQAIYSFRGADIHSYLTARRATEGRHATLPTNFRSTSAMVGAVNHLFQRADRHPGGAFRFPRDEQSDAPNPLPFHAVDAHGRKSRLLGADGAEMPALTAWSTPADEDWNAGRFRDEMARRTAGEIAAMLNAGQAGDCRYEGEESRGLQPRDIAVLVRNQDEGKLMRRALTDFAVPAVFLSERSSVFRSTEAADMLVWLEALAEPERSDRVRQAMATTSLSLELDELTAWLRDEVIFDEICNRFHDWHHVWQNQGVLAALMRLLHHFSVPARLLAPEARAARRGERRLTNLLHLAEWLQARDQDVDGETALIHRLHLAMTEGGDEQEIRLEQDAEMVRIVTVHSSKGLQYPVVFLPFAAVLGSEKNHGGKPTRRHRHDENVWEMEPDEAAAERAARESTAEEIRLLYVALTRAEFACILGAGPVKIGRTKQFNPGKTAWGQFLGFEPGQTCERDEYMATLGDWGNDPGIRITEVPEPRDPAGHRFVPPAEPPLTEARVPRFGRFDPWSIASFSSISASAGHGATLPAPEIAREELRLEDDALEAAGALLPIEATPPSGVHALPRGAGIGNLFHDMIEAMFQDGPSRYAGNPERVRRLLATSHHPGLRVLDECQQEQLAAQFDLLLDTRWELPASSTPMALAQLRTARPEMEFWLSLQDASTADVDRLVRRHVAADAPRPELEARTLNGMLKGFIDLTIAHDGRYYLLDWKSNWLGADLGAYAPEALERAMLDSRYDLQFVLYLVALHRHLADRLPDYDYDRHVGGAAYVFLRGIRRPEGTGPDNHGVYTCRPDRQLIEALDALFTDKRERVA